VKPCLTTGATRSAKTHAMLASEAGSTVNYKLSSSAWRKPYAEDLLETDSDRLLTVLDSHRNSSLRRCSVRPGSMQIGEYRVFQNAAKRGIVNSQSLPILDVPELLELIHKITDPAAG
jgi:hypothetical protein